MTDKIAKPFLKWAGGKNQLINDSEQIRLRDFYNKLDVINHSWILSSSDVKGKYINDNFFDDLYLNFNIQRVDARRNINANPEKRGELDASLTGRAFRFNLLFVPSKRICISIPNA